MSFQGCSKEVFCYSCFLSKGIGFSLFLETVRVFASLTVFWTLIVLPYGYLFHPSCWYPVRAYHKNSIFPSWKFSWILIESFQFSLLLFWNSYYFLIIFILKFLLIFHIFTLYLVSYKFISYFIYICSASCSSGIESPSYFMNADSLFPCLNILRIASFLVFSSFCTVYFLQASVFLFFV